MNHDDPSILHARQLLHKLTLHGPSITPCEPIMQALNQPIDWQYLLERGGRHKLLPLMNHTLSQMPAEIVQKIPPSVRRLLLFAALESKATSQSQFTVLKMLLHEFTQQNIPVMVVKGLTLAALYPEPSLRPCADIDLIVHERDWPTIAAVLEDLHFKPAPQCAVVRHLSPELVLKRASYIGQGQVVYHAPDGTIVEVHFRLLNIGIPCPVEDAWGGLRIERLGDTDIPTISCEDAVLYQALHMHGHHFTQMIWFTDLSLMLDAWGPQLDWSRMKYRVRDWHIDQTLAFTFELLEDLGGQLPEGLTASEFEPTGRLRQYFYRRRWPKETLIGMEHESPVGAPVWYYLHQRASWLDRFHYIRRGMFPPRACLGSEGRWKYLFRLLAHAAPPLQKPLHLPTSPPHR